MSTEEDNASAINNNDRDSKHNDNFVTEELFRRDSIEFVSSVG